MITKKMKNDFQLKQNGIVVSKVGLKLEHTQAEASTELHHEQIL